MERTVGEMLDQMTPGANPIAVDISSTDYTVSTSYMVKGISAVSGTVIKVDITDEHGNAVTGVLIPAGYFGVRGITKVYKTGTDATGIYLWTD
jgi:hypothetical protein